LISGTRFVTLVAHEIFLTTWVSVPTPDTDAAKMQIHLLQEKAQAYVIMLCAPDIMKEE
jgi:hypothetical protein